MKELKACCKINLGLRVGGLRGDGYHDIETVMVPVPGLFDTVAVLAMPTETTWQPLTPAPYPPPRPVFPTSSTLLMTGRALDCPPEENICVRALRLIQSEFGIGEVALRLEKRVPSGAGLGGGSSDAAAVMRALDAEFVLELTDSDLERLAAQLGSDVPFFIRATPQLCTGRGEIMTPVEVDLAGLWLVVVCPEGLPISTAEAYRNLDPHRANRGAQMPLPEILRRGASEWKALLINDFEENTIARHPLLAKIRAHLYGVGAIYAAMSGSGSAMFGLFDSRPRLADTFRQADSELFIHIERL